MRSLDFEHGDAGHPKSRLALVLLAHGLALFLLMRTDVMHLAAPSRALASAMLLIQGSPPAGAAKSEQVLADPAPSLGHPNGPALSQIAHQAPPAVTVVSLAASPVEAASPASAATGQGAAASPAPAPAAAAAASPPAPGPVGAAPLPGTPAPARSSAPDAQMKVIKILSIGYYAASYSFPALSGDEVYRVEVGNYGSIELAVAHHVVRQIRARYPDYITWHSRLRDEAAHLSMLPADEDYAANYIRKELFE